MSHNNLGLLGLATFYGLDSLSRLDLSHNSLTEVPANLSLYCPTLRHLGETQSTPVSHENSILSQMP